MTDPLSVTNQRSRPSVDPEPRRHAQHGDEDLAALLERLLAQVPDRTQKDLAAESGISYPTLNAWMNRTRGTSRIDPEKLRAMVDGLHLPCPAASRRVPGTVKASAPVPVRTAHNYREAMAATVAARTA